MPLLGILLGILLVGLPTELEAQRRSSKSVTVVRVDRTTKRAVYKKQKRVQRRTIKRLPSGTRAVVYRNRNYYPVRGMYYVSSKGVYVRTFPPVGFRIRTLAVVPVRVVVRNRPFWYAQGVFYVKQNQEYVVTETPIGAVVPDLPEDAEEIDFSGLSAYELNDVIYQEVDAGYEVIDLLEDV